MTKLEKLCIKWLNENYSPMERFEPEKYPNYIFHMKDGKCILQYNKKSGNVYVNYNEIWSFFESFFGMKHQQIQDLTKIWVEEQYNLRSTTTFGMFFVPMRAVEEQYNLRSTTTIGTTTNFLNLVEEQYNLRSTTTAPSTQISNTTVEEQYKMGVNTTDLLGSMHTEMVEEQYKVK